MHPYKPFRFALPAGGITTRAGLFNFVSILESSASQNLEIAFGRDGDFGEIPKGLSIEMPSGTTQTHVRFKNPTAETVEILAAFSAGRIIDNRLVLDASTPLPIDDSTPLSVDVTGQPIEVYQSNAGTGGFIQERVGALVAATAADVFTAWADSYLTELSIEIEEGNDREIVVFVATAAGAKVYNLKTVVYKGGSTYTQSISLPDISLDNGRKIRVECSGNVSRTGITVYGRLA